MITKVSILIDGAFFDQRFQSFNNKKHPTSKDVINEVTKVMSLVKGKTNGDTSDILFRIFYYDCKPYGEKIKSQDGQSEIDYSATAGYTAKNRFLKELCEEDRVALRLGELSFNGWLQDKHNTSSYYPDFKQKGVDMKIGLDMAWMGTNRIVEKIVLIAGDSDFVSPIKFVRKEGIQVYLYPMGHWVKESLINHCDFILK